MESAAAHTTEQPGDCDTFIVHAGAGTFFVDSFDEWVANFEPSRDFDPTHFIDFRTVYRFDLREWRQYWQKDIMASDIGFPDIGFWYRDGSNRVQYDGPIEDFREELRIQWGISAGKDV